MNDADYARHKARIHALVARWGPPLGLGWWTVAWEYVRDSGEYKVDGVAGARGVASTKVDWRYMHATITWNMLLVADQDDDELERIFVHECSHILVNESRDLVTDETLRNDREDWLAHEERMCSMLAAAFIYVRDYAARGEMAQPFDGKDGC